MTTVSETDLKEFRDLINNQFEQLNRKIDKLDGKVDELKISVAKLEEKSNGIDGRLTSLEGRVNGQTNWFIGIFSILVAGLLGILSKIALFPNP